MASRNLTPHRLTGNTCPAQSPQTGTESGAGSAIFQAHPSLGLAPVFAPKRDSPDYRRLGVGPTPAALAPYPAPTPDRLDNPAVSLPYAPEVLGQSATLGGGDASRLSLDTTEQLDQNTPKPLDSTPAQPARNAQNSLRKRARAKGLSSALAEGLAGLGSLTPLRHSYLATLACAGTLRQEAGVVKGKYCGHRWCVVCNRIRTAKLQQAYNPELSTWAHPHFVTLTLPNVRGSALHGEVRRLLKALTAVKRALKRTDGIAFRAVRKLEITLNLHRWTFHPHLHLLVDGAVASHALVGRWLELNPDASPKAQDVRPATNPAELFKYVTKLCTKVEGIQTAPPPAALDTMFKALRGLRTIQAMGFKVSSTPENVLDADGALELDASTPAPAAAPDLTEWHWLAGAVQDWVNLETGEVLADHTPTRAHLELLANVRAVAAHALAPPDISEESVAGDDVASP